MNTPPTSTTASGTPGGDWLEQLAELPVPPPPPQFDRGVHQRLNHWLLIGQLLDLVLRGMPYALWHFSLGMLGALRFTFTGTRAKDKHDK